MHLARYTHHPGFTRQRGRRLRALKPPVGAVRFVPTVLCETAELAPYPAAAAEAASHWSIRPLISFKARSKARAPPS